MQGKCPAAQALCRNDPDPHFRRGSGPVWTDWCALPLSLQILCFFTCISWPLSVCSYCWYCLCLSTYISWGMADSFLDLMQLASFWPPRQEQPLRALRRSWQARDSHTWLSSAPVSTRCKWLRPGCHTGDCRIGAAVSVLGWGVCRSLYDLVAYHCFMSMT